VTVEEQTQDAINITRMLLTEVLANPSAILTMAVDNLEPEAIEYQVNMILKYLDMTKPEESPETYEEAMTQAWETFKEGKAQTLKTYMETLSQAWKKFKDTEG